MRIWGNPHVQTGGGNSVVRILLGFFITTKKSSVMLSVGDFCGEKEAIFSGCAGY